MANETESKPNKKWVTIGVLVAAIVAIAGGIYWYTQVKLPHQRALAEYEAAVLVYDEAAAGLASQNDALTAKTKELEALTNSEDPPLDATLLESSGAVIGKAQAALVEVPPMPASIDEAKAAAIGEINEFTSEIANTTTEIEEVEPYDDQMAQLDEAITTLSNSIAQMKQLTNPSEKFVIERLTGLPHVTGVQAATEDHDPNKQLNKQGGYTAAVFFSSDLVNKSKLYNKGDIVTVGTDGGGSIEVYESVENAETRNTYLSTFDGTVLSSGSHHVVGTCVVRVSSLLTGSQQKALQESIVESLTRLG